MRVVLVLVWLFLSAQLFAQEIPGAFGIDFGTNIKDLDVMDQSKTSAGIPIYMVIPPNKVPFLNTYAVEITPKSKLVYAIWGRGEVNSLSECEDLLEKVASQMEKEFGVQRQKPPFDAKGYFFTAGNRVAIVKCLENKGKWNIYLQFYDSELEQKASEEWKAHQ